MNDGYGPVEIPRMSTRDYFAIHFATQLIERTKVSSSGLAIPVKQRANAVQYSCAMSAAVGMADALIKALAEISPEKVPDIPQSTN